MTKPGYFGRFRKAFLAAYVVLGLLLLARLIWGNLPEYLSSGAVAAYIIGTFLLRRATGDAAPFGYVKPAPSERAAAIKDILGFVGCFLGACATGAIGAMLNPTTTIGISLIIIPAGAFTVMGAICVARVVRRFLHF